MLIFFMAFIYIIEKIHKIFLSFHQKISAFNNLFLMLIRKK